MESEPNQGAQYGPVNSGGGPVVQGDLRAGRDLTINITVNHIAEIKKITQVFSDTYSDSPQISEQLTRSIDGLLAQTKVTEEYSQMLLQQPDTSSVADLDSVIKECQVIQSKLDRIQDSLKMISDDPEDADPRITARIDFGVEREIQDVRQRFLGLSTALRSLDKTNGR